MVVTLTYSDSFAGRDYFMEIKYPFGLTLAQVNQWLKLNDRPTDGGDDDEKQAREVAKTILKEKFPEITVDIDKIPFKWGGTL